MTVTIFDEEAARALLYRDQWDAKIAYRGNELRRYAGQQGAFNQLWENYQNIYRPDNFIHAFQTPGSEEEVPGEAGSYITPDDYDQNPAISSTTVRPANTRHAGDQNDHPFPAN